MNTIIGVDVGGTQIRAARFDNNLKMVEEPHRVHTFPGGVLKAEAEKDHSQEELEQLVFDRLIRAIREVMPEDKSDVRGVGLALPGPVSSEEGILIAPPALPWRNFNIRERVQDALGVPVSIGNDADLAGLAEYRQGAGKETREKFNRDIRYLIYFTVSTGVGGGIIINGRPFAGRGQGAEIGHMTIVPDGPMCGCGHRGHLEAVSSGTGIARIARYRVEAGESSSLRDRVSGDWSKIDAKMVGEAAQQGDTLALDVITQAGRYLGVAVASMMVIFNPDMFVFGGSVTNLGKLLFDPMGQAIREYAMDPLFWETTPLVLAKLGADVGLYGAAALVEVDQPGR